MWLMPCSSTSSRARSASALETSPSAAAPKITRLDSCPVAPNGARSIMRSRLRTAGYPRCACVRVRMSRGARSASIRRMGTGVDLYWIPLGAGGHFVRFNGRVFEAVAAALQRRPRYELFHAALVVDVEGDRYTIELAPSPDAEEVSRG